MRLFRNLIQLFDRRERWRLAALSLLLFVSSLLEVVGIGAILPFIRIVGDPVSVLSNPKVSPWLVRFQIDTARSIIITACVSLLALFLIKGLFLAFTMRVSYRFIYNKVLSLTRRLLLNYLRAPYLFHLHKNTADLVKNVTVETEAVGGVLKFALFLPTEIVVVFGLLTLMLVAAPLVALAGIATLGTLMWAVSAWSRKELTQLGQTRSEEHGRMIQWVNQSLGGIKEVKLLGRENFFADALARCGKSYTNALRRSTLITQLPRVILETSAALLIVAFVLLILLSGRDMKDIVGVLALFGLAIVRLVPSATRITNALHSMRFYAHAVTSVKEGLRGVESLPSPETTARSIKFESTIRLENLTFRYPDDAVASLHDVTLKIPRGARVAFVGASGAGKTTLANVLLGLLQPTSGRLLVDDVEVGGNLRAWQNQLGYIPQDIYLIDDSIRRNVAFGIPDENIDDDSVWRALDSAQLSVFVRGLEGGLDAPVGERGARISAGQRQRIGIARALYSDPAVLLLDEATSALDNETERLFAASIDALAGDKTIIIIAHRLTTVRDCDIIHLMEGGRVIASGTYDDLLGREPIFARFVYGLEPQPV